MTTEQVRAVLTAVLEAVKQAEHLLPNAAVLRVLEVEINGALANPFVLQALAWGFTGAADLAFFVLQHFGVPASLVKDLLAKAGITL